ncbi:MAG: hypothetical protein Q7R34_04465 [Dehalococcoidia bacterium]|nr:hypothetical protein [Dehalococcoidia bacterium]
MTYLGYNTYMEPQINTIMDKAARAECEPIASPLLTDEKFAALYPERSQEISQHAAQAQTRCHSCGGDCCRVIGCPIYSPQLSSCPIYDFRPVGYRWWLCGSLKAEIICLAPEEIQELGRLHFQGSNDSRWR